MDEYGVSKGDLGLEGLDDEEAEQALLAHFLHGNPRKLLGDGEEAGTTLPQVHRRLAAWLRMITGRDFALASSDPPSTDGENLFLPKAVPAPEDPWADEVLYRSMGMVQLGLAELGFLEGRARLGEIYKDWVFRSVYHLLSVRYVMRHYCEAFPGIAADFAAVRAMEKAGRMRVNVTEVPRDGLPKAFLPLYDSLTINLNWPDPGPEGEPARRAAAAVDAAPSPEAARLAIAGQGRQVREHLKRLKLGPPPLPYFVGILRPEWILADLARDVAAETAWMKGNAPLQQLLAAKARNAGAIPLGGPPEAGPKKGLRGRLKARLKKAMASPGEQMDHDLASMPAYGALRDDAQQKHKEVRYGAAKWSTDVSADELVNDLKDKPGDDGGREYDEWDHAGALYKISETKVYAPEAQTGSLAAYDRIVGANQKEIKQIRRQFEVLRVEERWVGGLPDGPEIDMNRALIALTDIAAGQQPREDFYKRFVRQRKDLAVMTLVDQSGSTQGQVLAAEQEAVILFAEGLRTLQVPHAFYGFNSNHPREVYTYRIKGFSDPYDDTVKKRLGNLRAQGGTHLGAIVRQACFLLGQQPQGRRVLILLSDGKPEARGDYRGRYGIKDTAMAVQEAARQGIHVHCISLDPKPDAEDYLREIFGPGRFLMLPDANHLPVRLPEVFRGLVR